MDRLYFAKHKVTQEMYQGMRNNAGFTRIGDLKRSIVYKLQYFRSDKALDDFDFYYVDMNTMKINKVE